jgi:hypothetical protein
MLEVGYQLIETTDIADPLNDFTIPPFWIQEDSVNYITKVLPNANERYLIASSPVGYPKSQATLGIREMRETSKHWSSFFVQEIFKIPGGTNRSDGMELVQLLCVLLDLILHCVVLAR